MTARDWSGLREAASAATPGPWAKCGDGIDGPSYAEVITRGPVECMAYCYGGTSTIDGDRLDDDLAFIAAANPAAIIDLLDELDAARDAHRDLVKRLGFGDDITEPMADNDTIVLWFEARGREADEWRESERWRDECHAAGHPDDEDCWECDPRLRLQKAEDALARVGALADDLSAEVAELREEVLPVGPSRVAHVYRTAGLSDAHDRLRAALAEVDR